MAITTRFAMTVARQALDAMNQEAQRWESVNGDDYEGCELGLFVYGDSSWTLDHDQYLTDHRNIVSVVPLAHYSSATALRDSILNEAI